jgi:beta-lactamase superfamily II metal-dependent hydrolase/DNA/RNA endonuclease YhcR with UshA esterase domain
VAAFNPSTVPVSTATLITADVTPATAPPPPSSGIVVTANLTAIGGSAAQALVDDGTNGDVTAGDGIFSFSATVGAATPAGAKTIPVTVTDAQARTSTTAAVVNITPGVEPIADVKVDANADTVPDRIGQVVQVRGIVTSIDFNGGTGIEYYIQDLTGGIDIFSSSAFGPFTIGQQIEVTGTVTQFSGLTELTASAATVVGSGSVTPQTVTLSAINESLEGKLVRIDNLTMSPATFAADTNYVISDGTAGEMRIDGDTNIVGTNAPAGVFSLVGLVSQHDTSSPFDSGYQILPRSTADIIPRTAPTGVGSSTPPSVAPGQQSQLKVTVTLGQNPPSTGVTVVADLSAIGGSATQTFFDDGTNGDDSPGDNVFSYLATVSLATSIGAKSMPATIQDAQARSSATTIPLNVQSASAPPVPLNLVATPGNHQVGLTWSASAGATGYNVKRSLSSGGPYITISSNQPGTSYTDNAVTNGVRYYYVVSALNGASESGDSAEANALPSAPPPSGSLARVYFVDIGQGAGTLIVGPPPTNKTLLIDAGETGKGNSKVIPLLNTLGISTIDYTIVTHYHVDHDAGMTEVINANRVAGTAYDNGDGPTVIPPVITNSTGAAYTAYKNALAAHSGTITRQTINPGTVIDLGGGMKATCLVAGGRLLGGTNIYISQTDLNSESISTLIQYNDFDFLISGDLTGGGSTTTAKTPDVETYVAQLAGDVDMVQLDHHGSTTANNRRFLGQLKAETSLASIGATNTFGHPNRETVNKYLNIPVTDGNTYPGTGIPNPGNGPVFYQTDPSPVGDTRCTLQGYSGADQAHAGQGTILLKTDGTTSFTLESFDDGGVRIPASAHVYDLDATGAGVMTNFPPTVVPNLVPGVPLATDAATVQAKVADAEDAITSVTLNYALNGAAQAPVMMVPNSGVFEATIPAQPNGTRVDYTITATAGSASTSFSNGYFSGITPISALRALNPLGEPQYLEYAARVQATTLAGTGSYSASTNDDYVSDATGALNVFRTIEPTSPAPQPTSLGSTYTIAGLIGQNTGRFRLEVTPPFDGIDKPWATSPGSYNPYQIALVSAGGAPVPEVKTIAQILAAPESFEAHLIRIDNCTVTSGTIPASDNGIDAFLTISDGTGTLQMKIDHDTDIPGLATPAGTFSVTGTLQQDDPLRPFDTLYSITPRNRTDLGAAAGGPSLITIADARADVDATTGLTPDDYVPDRLNQTVKVRGVVTSVDFRGAAGMEIYIQDPTGGVDIFNTSNPAAPSIGDSVEVVGQVQQFNGLTEINPGTSAASVVTLPAGTMPPVSPQVVTLSQIGDGPGGETHEGLLLRINNVTLVSPPATFAANTNYVIQDATGTGTIRIDSDTDIDGTAPPAGTFSIIGVLGQFDSSAPLDSGYQLFPRIRSTDFLPAVATPAAIQAIAGTPQSTLVNTAFATQLQAKVTDSGNNGIPGIGVVFTAPSTGASGTFAGGSTTANVTTDASGIATAPVFTANSVSGTYNVTATTNSLTANFSLTNLDPPSEPTATHFSLTAPASATVGVPFNVTVTALDAANAPVTGYAGTVHFTSSNGATVPADYTFVPGDNGSHVFSFTLNAGGAQTLTAEEGSISGSANITGITVATHFGVTAPASVQVGAPFNFTVTALDAADAVVTGYTGTVHFTSSNGANMPPDYTFVAGDNGSHTFSATLTNTGSQTIGAEDGSIIGSASINGTATPPPPAVVTHLQLTPSSSTATGPITITVSALDASNNVVPSYTGTIHWTSTPAMTLPADYTFVAGDNGVHTFNVTVPASGGPFTVSATDTATAISGSTSVGNSCTPPPAVVLTLTMPPAVCANGSYNVSTSAPSNWTVVNGTITAGQGTSSITFTAGASGLLQITAQHIVAPCAAPTSAQGSKTITPRPTATLPNNLAVCPGVQSNITASLTGTPPFTVVWSDGLTQTNISRNSAIRTFVATSPRTLRVTSVTDATSCTSGGPSNAANITLKPGVAITVQPAAELKIKGGETAHLVVTATGTNLHYQWFEGERGDETHPVGTDSNEFTSEPLRENKAYWVKVTADCGTLASETSLVRVIAVKRRPKS